MPLNTWDLERDGLVLGCSSEKADLFFYSEMVVNFETAVLKPQLDFKPRALCPQERQAVPKL